MGALGILAPRPPTGGVAWPVGRPAAAPVVRPADATVEVDADGRIAAVSRAAQQLLGWREADLRGRSLLTLTGVSSGRALSHGSMLLGAVRQGRRLRIGDVELICKDRSRLPVACAIAPRARDGVVQGAAFTFAAR